MWLFYFIGGAFNVAALLVLFQVADMLHILPW